MLNEKHHEESHTLILTTIIVTIIAVLILMNFVTGEKKIERNLKRYYSIQEPQFVRSVGALLGPAFLDGNYVEVLINGDKIFAEMLNAIKSAKKRLVLKPLFIGLIASATNLKVHLLSVRMRV